MDQAMPKKVLILMAERTGTGHRASANALEQALQKQGYQTKQLNCFPLMGKMGVRLENAYIPTTTQRPWLWKMAHTSAQWFPNFYHWFFYQMAEKKLLREIQAYQPDLIISVHGNFTKAVSKLLQKYNLPIPFYVVVIDLVNPPRVWRDRQTAITFVPTPEVREQYLRLGFRPEQVVVAGFPIREDIVPPTVPKPVTKPLQILMVNPSVNLRKNVAFVRAVAALPETAVTMVCGRDQPLFKRLTRLQKQGHFPNVKILGFVDNMPELLAQSHLLLTKAGPNMILEGVRSGTAVVVTGHIPGQEAHNYQFVEKYGCGFRCENPRRLTDKLTKFINSGELARCLQNVLTAGGHHGVQIITQTLIELDTPQPE